MAVISLGAQYYSLWYISYVYYPRRKDFVKISRKILAFAVIIVLISFFQLILINKENIESHIECVAVIGFAYDPIAFHE